MSTIAQYTIAAPTIAADPASPAHLAAARTFAADHASTLIRLLDDAIEDRLDDSGIRSARDAWESWSSVAYGQDLYLDQSFDAIAEALDNYERLADADDMARRWNDRDEIPGDDWRDDVSERLACAASEARRLRDSYPVNPNTAEWTQWAWRIVDSRAADIQRAAMAGRN